MPAMKLSVRAGEGSWARGVEPRVTKKGQSPDGIIAVDRR